MPTSRHRLPVQGAGPRVRFEGSTLDDDIQQVVTLARADGALIQLLGQAATPAYLPTVEKSEFSYFATGVGGRVAYSAYGERTNLTQNTEVDLALLACPANATVDLHIDKRALTCSAAGKFRRFRNAAVTLPTGGAQTNSNRGGGTSTGQGMLFVGGLAGLVIVGNGTFERANYVPANDEREDSPEGSIILRPGQTLLWKFTPGATGASAGVWIAWHELQSVA